MNNTNPLFLRRDEAIARLGVNAHTFDKFLDGDGLTRVYLFGGGRIVTNYATALQLVGGRVKRLPKMVYYTSEVDALKRKLTPKQP